MSASVRPVVASDLRLVFRECAGVRCLLSTRGLDDATPRAKVVVFIPPFAEEMNKSRRQFSLIAQALSRQGIASVLPDLPGTGDSEGTLSTASLPQWRQALVDCVRVLRTELAPDASVVMVGLRLGSLLGQTAWPDMAPHVLGAVWIAPVLNGEQHLTQFLRVAVAGAALRGEQSLNTRELRERLKTVGMLELAGYPLCASLVEGIDLLRAAEQPPRGPCHVIEVISRADVPLALPLQTCLDVWRSTVHSVSFEQTVGESFWASTEITTLPWLPDQVVRAVVQLFKRPTR